MTRAQPASGAWIAVRTAIVGLACGLGLILLILWLAGFFQAKVPTVRATPASRPLAGRMLAEVRTVRRPLVESAVGTISAVHKSAVASKLLAKVAEVNVMAGQAVEKDEVLVRLDDQDLRARRDQADAAVRAALAARDQAQIEFDRLKGLLEQNVATRIEFERAEAALKSAVAELDRAQQSQREAAVLLEYATIHSPLSGVIIDKLVQVGDTVTPGQTLLTIYDPTRMQLVASVRESLVQHLTPGQTVEVRLDALQRTCAGRVSEIVPESDVASRTFQVKVTGPCPPGLYTGMFGRLHVPLGEEEVVVVPAAAVRQIGQLDLVDVVDPGEATLTRRAVQLGRAIDGDREVLSGLRPGEQVALVDGAAATTREGGVQ